jgi:hypothetical protein
LVGKYVLHTKAAEIRGALKGIEHGPAVVKFGAQLRDKQNRTRTVIAKYIHRELQQRGLKARLKSEEICDHLDGVQLRVWQRRAWNPTLGDIVGEIKENLRYPMPTDWLAIIKGDEDDTGPWRGALKHPKLRGRVEKFLSVERRFATSVAANLYWAWLELAREMESVEAAAAAAEESRDPKQPQGHYLSGVIRRSL